jgi:hypothetical protein
LLMDRDEMSKLYRGPTIDASLYSWEGDRSDCYPEKSIVNRCEAEVDNIFFEG